MHILTSLQMRLADQFTIDHKPISSNDLMETAAGKCFDWIVQNIEKEYFVHVFCGTGNNGGDGLALARMLNREGIRVKATLLKLSNTLSADCQTNLERLKFIDYQLIEEISGVENSITFPENTIIIDALFGTGLSKNISGEAANLIRLLNQSGFRIISIDMPSGIYSDKTSLLAGNEIIKATTTLTFQYLKPALLMAENAPFIGEVVTLDIGLLPEIVNRMKIDFHITDLEKIRELYRPRPAFSHKGTFGHGLLICGGTGMMGAAILSSKAFLRSGAGLLTLLVPDKGVDVIHAVVPEAMVETRGGAGNFMTPERFEKFHAIGVGPGLGTGAESKQLVLGLLSDYKLPMVIDADALNLIARNRDWLKLLPPKCILTPHPGEFKRLVGKWKNDFDKLELQRKLAIDHDIYVILKGKNTSIACPDGEVWFNPTGNQGMAKGGSGDVLTGLLAGLLTRGYNPLETCLLGVYLHGLAGDIAAKNFSYEGMTAGDIAGCIPEAWKRIL